MKRREALWALGAMTGLGCDEGFDTGSGGTSGATSASTNDTGAGVTSTRVANTTVGATDASTADAASTASGGTGGPMIMAAHFANGTLDGEGEIFPFEAPAYQLLPVGSDPVVTDAHARVGGYSLEHTCRSDDPDPESASRSEIIARGGNRPPIFVHETEYWYGWSILPVSPFQIHEGYQIITQFHSARVGVNGKVREGQHNPPVVLMLSDDYGSTAAALDTLRLQIRYMLDPTQPMTTSFGMRKYDLTSNFDPDWCGRWNDFAMNVRWACRDDQPTGFIRLYHKPSTSNAWTLLADDVGLNCYEAANDGSDVDRVPYPKAAVYSSWDVLPPPVAQTKQAYFSGWKICSGADRLVDVTFPGPGR